MISRCSSPMPEILVWPVSLSVSTLKVGSSCISLARPLLSFSWSLFVFGSTASAITGAGNWIDSSTTGASESQIVSPVVTCFRPTAAAMSPAQTSLISSRLFACILSRRPMRSRWPFVVLSAVSPVFIEPE